MNSRPLTPRSLIETVMLMLLLLALLVALYDVLKVFFGVFTFALIFSVSFAGPFERLVRFLRNRRTISAVVYSVLLAGLIATPLAYLISSMSHHVKEWIHWLNEMRTNGIPDLPPSITRLPYIGKDIASFWQQLQENPRETIALHETQIRDILRRILTSGAGMLGITFELVTGIIVSAIFLFNRERALAPLHTVVRHLLGDKDGASLMEATAKAIKGVAIGVMGTAFVAAIVSWIGLTIAGIPYALGLSALVFFLVVIQIGPLLVWIPLIIWLATQGHGGWAIFAVAWGLLVLAIDSVLKPVLIARSGKLPFLVLFLGVIGGLVAWGFTGMFKGAIILAVFYTIFTSWLEKSKTGSEPDPGPVETGNS
jgi:predicted PurR-regulated permease PerM